MRATYLLLDLAVLAFPLVRSFEHRVKFVSWWPALALGILANGLYFIPTDAWFTAKGYWGFSDIYILGPRLLGLPLEEWLFFIVVPFACMFIYACVRTLLHVRDAWYWQVMAWVLVAVSGITALANTGLAYTSIKLGSAAVFLALFLLFRRGRGVGNFMVAYLITEIPFFIMNGFLTSLPVVWYNDTENLGIRMGPAVGLPFFNIPIEDNVYSLMMLTITVFVTELYLPPRFDEVEEKSSERQQVLHNENI